jgi:hypothetical protein
MLWPLAMAGVVGSARHPTTPALAAASAAPPYPRRGVLAPHLYSYVALYSSKLQTMWRKPLGVGWKWCIVWLQLTL